MAARESYLSRFFVKFIEISAAGVATAVSGYVLAHLTGYMNAPQPAAPQSPAALQVPATSWVPGAWPVTVPKAQVATPAAAPVPQASAPSVPAPAQPARTAVAAPQQQDANSAALRKSLPADRPAEANAANAADSADKKVRDVTDTKPRSAEAIAAEVRAALAKVDAAHPGKADSRAEVKAETSPRRPDNSAELAARTPAADSKARPAESPTGAIAAPSRLAAPPRAAAMTPPPAPGPVPQPVVQPAPQTPMQIAPPTTTVEIKSMPVAGVDSSSSAPQADAQADAQAQPSDGGLFSIFKRLPEKLRDDQPLPPDQAPRPPADVGQ